MVSELPFRRLAVAGTKLLNNYVCFEVNFEKFDNFRRKT